MQRSPLGAPSAATLAACALAFCPLAACSSSDETPSQETVAARMQAALLDNLQRMRAAGVELQAAAPAPPDRGWDAQADAAALVAMKSAWARARDAYEHVEGAIAPLFPDLDATMDARYDGFLAVLGAPGDANPFDEQGVTGMHAIERILYANVVPPKVLTFEATLIGYRPPAFPATAAEAQAFKTQLCGRFISDADTLIAQWKPQKIDISGAFSGLIGLVNEQEEKVNLAASGEEESRYAARTMADLRSNLDGTRAIYALFVPWLKSTRGPADAGASSADAGTTAPTSGSAIDAKIAAGFARLEAAYAAVPGDAIPEPPATWSAETPSAADLATPFGRLWSAIRAEVDTANPDSLVNGMAAAAHWLGIPVVE